MVGFFKNYRVYVLTTVAYMGSLLFGKCIIIIIIAVVYMVIKYIDLPLDLYTC